jgi:hypothetical protein
MHVVTSVDEKLFKGTEFRKGVEVAFRSHARWTSPARRIPPAPATRRPDTASAYTA